MAVQKKNYLCAAASRISLKSVSWRALYHLTGSAHGLLRFDKPHLQDSTAS